MPCTLTDTLCSKGCLTCEQRQVERHVSCSDEVINRVDKEITLSGTVSWCSCSRLAVAGLRGIVLLLVGGGSRSLIGLGGSRLSLVAPIGWGSLQNSQLCHRGRILHSKLLEGPSREKCQRLMTAFFRHHLSLHAVMVCTPQKCLMQHQAHTKRKMRLCTKLLALRKKLCLRALQCPLRHRHLTLSLCSPHLE